MKLQSTTLPVLALSSAAKASLNSQSPLNQTCAGQKPVLSCSAGADPSQVDSCCVETFGGLVLQTQFWDVYTGFEEQGQLLPPKSWTIHGLWPDFCNGTYTQYCDLNRQYDPEPAPNTTTGTPTGPPVPAYKGPSVEGFLESLGKTDLIKYMKKYWIAQNQPNWYLWAHEFSKHATCFSTFDIPCYGPNYKKYEELAEFYETTIKFYKKLPSFDWLAESGIKPSNKTSYTLSDIQGALSKKYGGIPFVGCSGPKYNETQAGAGTTDKGGIYLSEIWYYSNVYGRTQDHKYIPVNASSTYLTNCAKTKGAVQYLERSRGSETKSEY